MIEFSEQGQSEPQLYHAHLFFDTSNVEMPLLHEQFVIAREQHECDSVSSDTIEVTLGYALLSKLPEDTEDMTSRHLKDLFPKSMRISVVSITLDNGPCTVMRVKVLERDGSSSDVVVKFLLNEQSYINGFQSRLATEPMRAYRAYSCLSESVPRLVAGPINPEKGGIQAFAMDFFAEEYRSCDDVVPGPKIRKAIRNLFFSPGLLNQIANFTARVEPEIDSLLDIQCQHPMVCLKRKWSDGLIQDWEYKDALNQTAERASEKRHSTQNTGKCGYVTFGCLLFHERKEKELRATTRLSS